MSSISGAGYLQAVYDNRAKEQELRKAYGYSEQDNVTVYTLPKDQIGKKYGSRTYRPMSMKAQRLQQSVYLLRGEITSVQNADMPRAEKAQKLSELKNKLKCASIKLTSEINATPQVGLIVLELEEEA